MSVALHFRSSLCEQNTSLFREGINMKELTEQQQQEIHGGKWGFLCGASVALGLAAAITTGGLAIGGGMLLAEWGCAIDAVTGS
jgi:hypothetical protein